MALFTAAGVVIEVSQMTAVLKQAAIGLQEQFFIMAFSALLPEMFLLL